MYERQLHRQGARAEIDPELERQLRDAAEDQPVEAVLLLCQAGPSSCSRTDAAALIGRAGARASAGAIEWNFLPRLGVLIVRARPRVIRELIAEPEVMVASANCATT